MTLRDFRDSSGKTIPVILEELAARCPDAPTTEGGYLNMERRGVQKAKLIRALAIVLGRTEEEIENAEPEPSQPRRGRRTREAVAA
jgi:transcriptional regulator with XRE-family HTH domain